MTILDFRTDQDTLPLIDLGSAAMYNNPYPRFAELRRTAPVSRVKDPIIVRGTGYMLTRYEDVSMLLNNRDNIFSTDTVRNGEAGKIMWLMPETIRLLFDTMAFKDDPDHKRLKNLVHRAFTPKLVMGMTDEIARVSGGLVSKMAVKAAKGEIDMVDDFAMRLPLTVIATMLGISESDQEKFHGWTQTHSDAMSNGIRGAVPMLWAGWRLMRFFEYLARENRVNPNDGLISQLIRANDDGDKLSDREVLAMVFLLLLSGHDTTSSLISSSILALVNHPDQLAALQADPTLIETGMEEFIRYTTPVACGNTRIAMEDTEIADVHIPRNSQVLGMIISANRGEDVFADGERLDLARTPNKHIGLGGGVHYCLGHQLARIEGRIAITQLVQAFSEFEITVPQTELRYRATPALRGLRRLPMRLR